MTDHGVLVLVSLLLSLAGCAADAGSAISRAELAARPADYEGRA